MTIELREEGALIDSVKPGYYGCDCGYGCSGGGGCNCTGDTPTPTPDTGITSIRIIVADTITDTGKASVVFTPSTARTSFYFSSSDESIAVINPETGRITVIQTGVVTFCVEDLLSGLEDCKVVNVIKSEPEPPETGCTGEYRIKAVYDVTSTTQYTQLCSGNGGKYVNGVWTALDNVYKFELEDGTDITSSVVEKYYSGPGKRYKCFKFGSLGRQTVYLTLDGNEIGGPLFYDVADVVSVEIPCQINLVHNGYLFTYSEKLEEVKFKAPYLEIVSLGLLFHNSNNITAITMNSIVRRRMTTDEMLEDGGDFITGHTHTINSASTIWYTFEGCFSNTFGDGTFPVYSLNTVGKSVIVDDTLVSYYGPEDTEYTIPYGVKRIGRRAFNGANFTGITIPDTVEVIGYNAFSYCKNLKSVVIPNSVKTIAEGAFEGCEALETVTIGSGVTEIGMYCFNRCTSLKTISIPDSVINFGNNFIEEPELYVPSDNPIFYRCSSLISVNIGDGVSKIEPDMFTGCTSLETLTLGSGVTECSFRSASSTNLSTIICKAVNAPVPDYLQFLKSGGTLYYPAGSDYSSWLNVLNNWTGQEITG